MKTILKLAALTAMTCLATAGATWATIAYDNASGVAGLQNFGNSLGLDFDVNKDINISALGAFDNGDTAMLDGVDTVSGVTVAIFDRTTGLQVGPSALFTPGSPGTQINGDAFKDVTLTLLAGFQGSVVAYNDRNYNSNGGVNTTSVMDSGGGLISFVGGGRWANGFVYPGNIDGGPVNRYDAGTFQFSAVVPEPSTLMLIGLGLAGLWASRKRFAI